MQAYLASSSEEDEDNAQAGADPTALRERYRQLLLGIANGDAANARGGRVKDSAWAIGDANDGSDAESSDQEDGDQVPKEGPKSKVSTSMCADCICLWSQRQVTAQEVARPSSYSLFLPVPFSEKHVVQTRIVALR